MCDDDVTAEMALVGIKRRDGAAFFRAKQLRQNGAAMAIELARERLPIIASDPSLRGG